MIVGMGVDVCEVARFEAMAARSPGLVIKLLSPGEAALPIRSQAARFAAKEALAKALGAPAGLGWHDAEVVTDQAGRPLFELQGTVAARLAELGGRRVHLSLTHDAGLACAVVVCED